MTGEDQAVMFGGVTPSGESSEAHVLHLPTMVRHFSHTHDARGCKSHFILSIILPFLSTLFLWCHFC